MLDLPVTAMLCLGIYALIKTEDFESMKASILFGLVSGLGMITKWSYLFFICILLIHSFIKIFYASNKFKRILRMVLACIMFLIIAGPWYLKHLSNLFADFITVSYDIGKREGDPEVFSLSSLLFYIVKFPSQILVLWLIFFLVGLYFFLFKEIRHKQILLLWMLGGYLILTIFRNKEIRYFMPILPAVAIISVFWLDKIKWSFYRKFIIITFPVLYSIIYSFYLDFPQNE